MAEHSWEMRAYYGEDAEGKDLLKCTYMILTSWVPLTVEHQDEMKNLPLYKLVYMGNKHNPSEHPEKMPKLNSYPTLTIAGQYMAENRTIVVGDNTEEAYGNLTRDIKDELAVLVNNRNDVTFDMKRGFAENIHYKANGQKQKTNPDDEEDKNVVHLEEQDLDPKGVLKEDFGPDWERKIGEIMGQSIVVPRTRKDLFYDSNSVYPVTRKGVEYYIRKFDPASTICDPNPSIAGRLYPRAICMMPAELRPEQMIEIAPLFAGDFDIHAKKEITWPGWTHPTRKRGLYRQGNPKPGTDPTKPIRVLPQGGLTDMDVLYAYGHSLPAAFEPERVPRDRFTMNPTQFATDPHWKEGYQFLEPRDRFIAAGSMHTIPNTKVNTGKRK